MAGGDRSLTWVAPETGAFEDLALRSDSPTVHQWAGRAGLVMERIFFTPLATCDYSGKSGQNQPVPSGSPTSSLPGLVIRPSVERGISLGDPIVNLIR